CRWAARRSPCLCWKVLEFMAIAKISLRRTPLLFVRALPIVLLCVVLFWYAWFMQFSSNALFMAATRGNAEQVKIVLARGVPVDATEAMGKSTALMMAAHNPDPETARVLLDAGANVNAKNVFGNTALILASSSGRLNV